MLRIDLSLRRGDLEFSFDLEVDQGERLLIMGPSGAGKTTLLDLIAGFERPDAGLLTWNGESLLGRAVGARPVSYLFQSDNLFPHLTAAQNVALALPKGSARTGRSTEVPAALESVGLAGRETSKPAQLSGGQRQRLALARTLLLDRPILLLDEPMSALDETTRDEVVALIVELSRKKRWTVLLVSHDPALKFDFATRCVGVRKGRVENQ